MSRSIHDQPFDIGRMPPTSITVVSVSEGEDLRAVRALFEQYRHLSGGEDLEKEGIAEEIAGLPWVYQAPYGDLFLARMEGAAAGCVALRTRAAADGELRRMFVLPGFRDLGVGHALTAAALERAWTLGMSRVCPMPGP
jgi:putative acetyltransferase